ncbi:MAG: hypothetical protein JXQ83_08805, partial [Candidatus Glassbacteria bacterium]|nr:hypothetical protein [Candidatus Glassbacteria bacterium]
VTFSGTGITVLTVPATFNGSSQLLIDINIGAAAATGLRNVTVNNPDGLSGTGNNLFQVLAAGQQPGPIINQVVPDSALQGETNKLVSIQGQNFQPAIQVVFSNPGISIVSGQYINSTEVRGTINISAGASTGTGTVTATNPDGQFDQANFKVVAVVPNIAQINPVSSGAGTIWIDVTGSAFLSGIAATKSGTGLTVVSTQYKNSTWVRVRVDIDSVLIGRDVQIILTNPGGGSDQATFHVNGTWFP